jgi:uncharacterized protein (UPF0212 family)
VLTSATLVGAAEAERLFDAAYAEHARRLARALRGSAQAVEKSLEESSQIA